MKKTLLNMVMALGLVAGLTACGGGSEGNAVPTVNAGVDKSVTVNSPVTVTGTASDSDGSIVSTNWSEAGSIIATTLSFAYTPTSVGGHTLTLTVMDNDGVTATDTMVVTSVVSTPTITLAAQSVNDNGGGFPTRFTSTNGDWGSCGGYLYYSYWDYWS
jgi:hypothetical protein